MQDSPDNITPGGTMPEATQCHGDHQVSCGGPVATPTSTQWNEQVIAKPGTQADMPAMPELGNVLGQIRQIEILIQSVSKEMRQPNGHI